MDSKEKYIARLIFRNKIFESNGNQFEFFFSKVMFHINPNFQQVKPQGKFGDRKNDGFDRTTGCYYQVYAPEKPENSFNEALKKIQTDFLGLKKNWDTIRKIEEFYFVFNDKYKGVSPVLEAELAKIKIDHGLKEAGPFAAKDLEALAFKLKDDQIFDLLGHIPRIENAPLIKIAALNDVVEFLYKNKKPIISKGKLLAPDFYKKIEFNGLSHITGSILNTYSYQSGVVEKYFSTNGEVSKEHLREIFYTLYTEAIKKLKHEPDDSEKGDKIFFNILENSTPEGNGAYQDPLLALISFFFESCDIFEEPEEK